MDNTGRDWRSRARMEFDTFLGVLEAEWNTRRDEEVRLGASKARNEFSESLNQGLRRIRQAGSPESLHKLAVELTEPNAPKCALFLFHESHAEATEGRGLGPLPIRFAPNEAAAFRAAIESQDPVIAVAIPSEISPALMERIGTETTERVFLFPLVVRGQVHAVLLAVGVVSSAILELIAGLVSLQWETLTAPAVAQRDDLVSIGGAQSARVPQPGERKGWADLDPTAQALHLRAQRSARLRVAEMRLEHGEALRRGLADGNLYEALRKPIDQAREEFRRDFISASPTMVDYLYLEIIRGLAQDNEHLLGINFPGPLV